ncbi:HD-GYP domain-containing protein [Calderihabitans maritimus]|uniref:Metal dependent phosphohydrolase n=1 Tax=Calderihabitans maritimus TaxID=1246530 RepID=A0A1Z5HUY3_9FIRM|nr:HD-GYP domain-containing protein [Calderihabitans maritimus]GAW93157.1 metal dependent phosphohydrolase [Calderihabitans maritimus]
MKGISLKARVYIISIIILGTFLFVYLSLRADFQAVPLQSFLVFLVLVAVSNVLYVELPKGGYVTVNFAIYYTLIILFGASISVWIMVLGDLLGEFLNWKINNNKAPWYKILFNEAQFCLAVGLAGLSYEVLAVSGGHLFQNWLALVAALFIFMLINTGAVATVLALTQNLTLMDILSINIKWSVPNFLALAPLGLLIAAVYRSTGIMGVLLFFIPLLVARHSFKLYMDMRKMYLKTIETLATAMEAKDAYTRGHSERVARYTVATAKELKMREDQVENLRYLALLHDIGKTGTRESILNKPGRLDRKEFEVMKKHAELGAEIVRKIEQLQEGYEVVKYHHERWDGGGYPEGISGQNIPLGARIIAVADAFDAMTTNRPYREAMSAQQAWKELQRFAGTQFDPEVVEAFGRALSSLGLEIKEEEEREAVKVRPASIVNSH